MERKNKKIFIIVAVILIILIVTLVVVIVNNKNKANSLKSATDTEGQQLSNSLSQSDEEKKARIEAIRNIKGKITSIDIGAIEVVSAEAEKLILKIPQEGANFFVQTKLEDGTFVNKEVGLFEIPINEDVFIQYNSVNNEVMLVEVK